MVESAESAKSAGQFFHTSSLLSHRPSQHISRISQASTLSVRMPPPDRVQRVHSHPKKRIFLGQDLHKYNIFTTFAAENVIPSIMNPSAIPTRNDTPLFGTTQTSTAYPTIRLAELNDKTLSVEESEQRLSQLIHDFYHPQA